MGPTGAQAWLAGGLTPRLLPPLQDVLARHGSDRQQLAAALREVNDDDRKLELCAEGLQGLVKHLLQV